MDTSETGWSIKNTVKTTLSILAVAVFFFLVYRFHHVLFTLFIAIILGTVVRPLLTRLVNKGLSQTVTLLLILAAVLVLLAGFIGLLAPMISAQSDKLAADIPRYYQVIRDWLVNSRNLLVSRLSESLPSTLGGQAETANTEADVLKSAGQALGYLSTISKVLFMAITITALTGHWAVSGQRLVQSMLISLPQASRLKASALVSDIEGKVSGYLGGQGLLCLAIGVLAFAAYALIGLPNAMVLAIIAGLMEAVPMIGPLLGAIPAAVIALTISPIMLIWVVVATVVIQQLENNLLVPRVMKKAVGVNPFVSLLSIATFSALYGIGGALMAIPLAAIIQLVLENFVFNKEPDDTTLSENRGAANRLRYETQDFAQGMRNQVRQSKEGTTETVAQVDRFIEEMEGIAVDLDALLATTETGGKA
ncbi:MAG TPA: AI-2E family transporter [Anaerolineaceae bacterium]|nr:AI-2E family transporter [Anaerolineaceae bacterium]